MVNLLTTITTPVCLRSALELTADNPSPVTVVPGSSLALEFTVLNYDSVVCSSVQLQITFSTNPVTNLGLAASQSSITLAPSDLSLFAVYTPQTVPADAVAGNYTLTVTVKDLTSGRTKTITTLLEIKALPKLRLTAPNGGEKWALSVINVILWTPYAYSPVPMNPAIDVVAYLERATSTGYEMVGQIIETGQASIHWNGAVDQYNKYPAPGQYFVRIKNTKTNEWDRSDAPFTLLPRPVDLKINSSDGPISVTDNQKLTVFWKVNNVSSCSISGIRQTSGGITVNELSVPAINTTRIMYADSNVSAVFLSCTRSNGEKFSDYVALTPAGDSLTAKSVISSLTVTSPTVGATLIAGKSYTINWKQSGLVSPSIALYQGDKWIRWLATDINKDRLSWIPTKADADLVGGTDYKIYVTADKLDGTGYVDDKSDMPFTITSSDTAQLSLPESNPFTAALFTNQSLLASLLSLFGRTDQ